MPFFAINNAWRWVQSEPLTAASISFLSALLGAAVSLMVTYYNARQSRHSTKEVAYWSDLNEFYRAVIRALSPACGNAFFVDLPITKNDVKTVQRLLLDVLRKNVDLFELYVDSDTKEKLRDINMALSAMSVADEPLDSSGFLAVRKDLIAHIQDILRPKMRRMKP